MHDPNLRAVREIQAAALHAVLRDRPLEGPVALDLPAGTSAESYQEIIAELDADVIRLDDERQPATVLEVEQIRVRGTSAEVDVIRPRNGDVRQRVTVELSRPPFSKWAADRIYVWRGRVE